MNLILKSGNSKLRILLALLPFALILIGCTKPIAFEEEQAAEIASSNLEKIIKECDETNTICFTYNKDNGYVYFEGSPEKFYSYRFLKPWCAFKECNGKWEPEGDFYYTNEEFVSLGKDFDALWFELLASNNENWHGPAAGSIILNNKPVINQVSIKPSLERTYASGEKHYLVNENNKEFTVTFNAADSENNEIPQYSFSLGLYDSGKELIPWQVINTNSIVIDVHLAQEHYALWLSARDKYAWSEPFLIDFYIVSNDLYNELENE